jgi:hypothetical protein
MDADFPRASPGWTPEFPPASPGWMPEFPPTSRRWTPEFPPTSPGWTPEFPPAGGVLRNFRGSDWQACLVPAVGWPGPSLAVLNCPPAACPPARSHTGPSSNTSHGDHAAGDLQQDHWSALAHPGDIFLQRSPKMIFDALNQGRLQPGDRLTSPSYLTRPIYLINPVYPPAPSTHQPRLPTSPVCPPAPSAHQPPLPTSPPAHPARPPPPSPALPSAAKGSRRAP